MDFKDSMEKIFEECTTKRNAEECLVRMAFTMYVELKRLEIEGVEYYEKCKNYEWEKNE